MRKVLTLAEAQKLPKIISHEHLDCSVRPARILELGSKLGLTSIPREFTNAWRAANGDATVQEAAAAQYQRWIQTYASGSLPNYLDAIGSHILPVMQCPDNLYRITKDRIEDAVADGIIAMKLRFAPQLHRREGLTLQKVIDPIQQAVSESPFPLRLVICSLRHENGRLGRHLANAVIRNPLVSSYDLAGNEFGIPGVLPWWARQALRVHQAGKQVLCHIGESHPITSEDHERLDAVGCTELGHAIKGDPRNKLCTVCMTSNLVTHIVPNLESHPVDQMEQDGKQVTIDIDGLTFTGTTGSHEYVLMSEVFGWDRAKLLRSNLRGLKHFPVTRREQRAIEEQLRAGY